VLACQRDAGGADPEDDPRRKLCERDYTRVFGLCHDLTGDFQDAHDATQETFSRAFRRLESFLFQSRFAHWLFRIATNACIDLRRARRARQQISIDGLLVCSDPDAVTVTLPDDRAAQPFEQMARDEMGVDVHRAIAGLSDKLREIVVLRYFEDLSYEDIRERLGVSMGTVKSRLFRAHEALQYWLEPAMAKHSA